MAKCAICGKSIPITLPPYMRVYEGKDGKWKAYKNICKCNLKMYELSVLGLIKDREKKE